MYFMVIRVQSVEHRSERDLHPGGAGWDHVLIRLYLFCTPLSKKKSARDSQKMRMQALSMMASLIVSFTHVELEEEEFMKFIAASRTGPHPAGW